MLRRPVLPAPQACFLFFRNAIPAQAGTASCRVQAQGRGAIVKRPPRRRIL
ncbi:hypothetical protein HMPREF9123_0810 [Neisseria bacilliformis ATCC BAA-1200]|uniref:Uncharacterized protein n=1 Tax=Neisseria bacilliformis ATCC BAA-1200 TaxID=888742 RepID=F2BAQ6_9NEIS|nr:hypothetical protein HMPREF9123_0810 [Neisseria bacilliformis ATCC BAA-1200]